MSTSKLAGILILCTVLLLPLVSSNDGYNKPAKKVNVVVEGMVYCQNCAFIGTGSLTKAQPMAAAKVGVTCKNHKSHVGYYKTFEADNKGYFFAQLDGFHSNPIDVCHVKLVSSPLANCTTLTNVNNGLNGASFKFVKELRGPYYEAALYKVAPLAFSPVMCPVY